MPTAERGGPCGCEACVTVSRVAHTIYQSHFVEAHAAEGLFVHMATAYGWEGPWENEIEEEAGEGDGVGLRRRTPERPRPVRRQSGRSAPNHLWPTIAAVHAIAANSTQPKAGKTTARTMATENAAARATAKGH